MRPNYAQDAPPTSLEVGGFAYPVQVDFRVWIDVLRELEDWIAEPVGEAQLRHNAQICIRVQQLAFGGVLTDEDPAQVMAAVVEFARGYPSAPTEDCGGEALYSFDADLNWIVLAIRNQSGIDLSYRRQQPFHWWEFLLEFQSLCGEHYILRLMEARGYRGDDAELTRRRRRLRLPEKRRTADAARLAAVDELFYNAK